MGGNDETGSAARALVDVTSLRQKLLDDPVIDWLQLYGHRHGLERDPTSKVDFNAFIFERGQAFERAVLKLLAKRWPVALVEGASDTSIARQRTLELMQAGAPIIAGAALVDDDRGLRGRPDLLVRSDVLLSLTPSAFDAERVWRKANDRSLSSADIASIPAPLLGNASHYRVVDIKFTGLHLDRRGHVGNLGSAPSFKGQVWLYNQMLGKLQGYTPPAAFLLGRSWAKGTTDATFEEGRSCFDRLGPVFIDDLLKRGLTIEDGIAAALSWQHRLRADGHDWSVDGEPTVPELRPNMKNKQDAPWHQAKKVLAERQGELTQLWQVGIDLRNRALAGTISDGSGGVWPAIRHVNDSHVCAETLGVTKPSVITALDASLAINRSTDAVTWPAVVSVNADEWRRAKRLELFIDFETVNDLDDDFAALPERGGQPLIFMVGVGRYLDDGSWSFQCFVADRLSIAAEGQMLDRFFQHLADLQQAAGVVDNDVVAYHWSPAEESMLDTSWASARSRHPHRYSTASRSNSSYYSNTWRDDTCLNWPKVPWYDFLNRVVKKQPFVVKGATGFGLKAIGKALHAHGLIQTSWTDGPTDGMGAMVLAWQAERQAQSKNSNTARLLDIAEMAEVVTYNEVDCRVMAEVIQFVRGTSATTSTASQPPTIVPSPADISPASSAPASVSQEHAMKIISAPGERAVDDLRIGLAKSTRFDVVTPTLALPALAELGKPLLAQKTVRLVLPASTADVLRLFGEDGDRAWRNTLQQRSTARRVADWLEDTAEIRWAKSGVAQSTITLHSAAGPELAMTGTASLTTAGLGITPPTTMPFVSVFSGAAECAAHSGYYESLWNGLSANPLAKQQLLATLRSLDEPTPPALIYFLMLKHLFADMGDDLDEDRIVNPDTGIRETMVWKKLFRFQRDGAVGAIDKLQKYGGCIIADSVGLGKTFEALAVIKYYELRNQRVLVLCPKRLRDNWTLYKANDHRNVLADDRFHYDVLNHTDLSRDSGFSGDIDLSNVKWSNYDLVVIDESHNFRNNAANKGKETRYGRLMQQIVRAGVKTRVLMLSATPVNNRLADLKNQIAFATEGDDHALRDKGVVSIEKTTRLAQQQFNRWLELDDKDRTPGQLIDMLGFDYFKLLDLLTIARSRKHVERYYGTSETGKFPERLKPINIKADVDSEGTKGTRADDNDPGATVPTRSMGDYRSIKDINDEIRKLNLSSYSPLKYVLPNKRAAYDEKYATSKDGKQLFQQVDREQSLIHLLRVNMLKRMESAVSSFQSTLQRQLDDVDAMLKKLDAHDGSVSFWDDEASIEDIDIDDTAFEALLVGNAVKVSLADVDKVKWRQDLHQDHERLGKLSAAAAAVSSARDDKLHKLQALITQKANAPLNGNNKKVIVFSAFADTAKYLYEHIGEWARTTLGLHAALVTGGGRNQATLPKLRSDLSSILTAFSPRSKSRPADLANDGDIDILIATDCISEGQNLQDCDMLVNYDIHWNPVRIIQRFGRIDRIGSQNDYIQLVNFWPNIELEEYIDLERRVAGRMVLVDISASGEENLIDNTDKNVMNDLEYRRRQLLKLQDEVIDLEDLSSGVSISDLTLNDFRMDLARFLKDEGNVLDQQPPGAFSVTTTADATIAAGTIFCLRACGPDAMTVAEPGYPLSPHFVVHVGPDGALLLPYTQAKQVLDRLKRLCIEGTEPDAGAVVRFDKLTRAGDDMTTVQKQLSAAVAAVTGKKEERAVASLFSPGGTHAKKGEFAGTNDFEVVAFLVVLPATVAA